jgi:diphosphomevalonate decarboxylase
MKAATARACANIALVKYWGKLDTELNLPATGSLSLTLGALTTTTAVRFNELLAEDTLVLDGRPAPAERLTTWLDLVRAHAHIDTRAEVTSVNDFPTASGLASSASAYAALAVAATAAAGLDMSAQQLSSLARRGSGSAARSLFGGFVEMGETHAEPVDSAADWDIRMLVAVVGGGAPKSVSSRDAMEHCRDTSPLYGAWLDCVPADLAAARAAIAARDLDALGAVMQHSALAMHAAALASRPPVRYWRAATLAVMDAVDAVDGAYYTMDAGPHVKVLTAASGARELVKRLRAIDGVTHVIESGIGGPAELVSAG